MPGPIDAPQPVTPQQLGALLDCHGAPLAAYAAQWTCHAEDCVQEAFVELARLGEAPANPPAWLYRVVRHRALNAGRAERRRTNHEHAAASGRGPQRSHAAWTGALEIADALSALDPLGREIVVLRVWGQLSWQDIADVIHRSTSSAQRDYITALEKLRQLWEPHLCPLK